MIDRSAIYGRRYKCNMRKSLQSDLLFAGTPTLFASLKRKLGRVDSVKNFLSCRIYSMVLLKNPSVCGPRARVIVNRR